MYSQPVFVNPLKQEYNMDGVVNSSPVVQSQWNSGLV